jgi:diguanylate cyclase (GGDEF)-like protein
MIEASERPIEEITVPTRRGTGRDFAGTNTKFVIQYLRAHASPAVLQRVLDRAGELRDPDTLADVVTWSSYAQFRSLLAACAAELGDNTLTAIGLNIFSEASLPEGTATLQAFGSPASLYADIGPAAATLSPLVDIAGDPDGAEHWVMTQRFKAGYEPFREYCNYSAGVLGATPQLFGYPTARVIEEACQCLGAPACRFRVTWQATDEPTRRVEQLDMRVKVLQGSLEALQSTVADLVSGEGVDCVLARIISSAARAVSAPGFVLAVEKGLPTSRRVFSDGLTPTDAKRIAGELLSGRRQSDATCLVVELASKRCTYGRLAAVNADSGFYGQELATLQAYGRLAAAALDAAAALEETRVQATRAEALLTLATALAETASSEEMAQRIATAVPLVVDCDRAIVVLAETPSSGRIAAVAGYSDDVAETLVGSEAEMTDDLAVEVKIDVRHSSSVGSGHPSRQVMDRTGTTASATIPMTSGGLILGSIIASVTNRPERLVESADLEARLRGLAAQAATAINNATVLDHVRRQALHDPLTDLPNRALILDRAEQMFSRANDNGRSTAVLFIDLDDFKVINDTWGHAAGDQVLKGVAKRLTSATRAHDTVGRIGGDEFIVLAEDVKTDGGARAVAERIMVALAEPVEVAGVDGATLTVSASIGIATGRRASAADLFHDADVALYRAKAAGKSRAVEFDPCADSLLPERSSAKLAAREIDSRRPGALCPQSRLRMQE